MLATLARSEIAAQISINIIDAFIRMKHAENQGKVLSMEIHQLVQKTNKHAKDIEWLTQQFEQPNNKTQGIFFNNQIFDAYAFTCDLIKRAKNSIVLLDNYVDKTTLVQLSKRNARVTCTVYTEKNTEQLRLDLEKHNGQYPPIEIRVLKKVNDRFLIIDNQELYHLGWGIDKFEFTLTQGSAEKEIILLKIKLSHSLKWSVTPITVREYY